MDSNIVKIQEVPARTPAAVAEFEDALVKWAEATHKAIMEYGKRAQRKGLKETPEEASSEGTRNEE